MTLRKFDWLFSMIFTMFLVVIACLHSVFCALSDEMATHFEFGIFNGKGDSLFLQQKLKGQI